MPIGEVLRYNIFDFVESGGLSQIVYKIDDFILTSRPGKLCTKHKTAVAAVNQVRESFNFLC